MTLDVLTGIGTRFLRLHLGWQIVLVLVVLALKSRFTYAPGMGAPLVEAMRSFPSPGGGYVASSIGDAALGWALGVSSVSQSVAMHLVLIGACFGCAILFALRSQGEEKTTLLVIIFSATATVSLLQSVGNYDPITYTGSLFLVLGKARVTWSLGAVLLALGNPEQAVIISVSLLGLSLIQPFRRFRSRSTVALCVSLVSWILVMHWMQSGGITESRLTLIPDFFAWGLDNFLANPSANIWSWFGPAWIVVLSLTFAFKGKSRWIFVVFLGVIPSLATISTVDGARVFGLLSFSMILVVQVFFWRELQDTPTLKRTWLGLYIVVWLITPSTVAGWGIVGQLLGSFFYGLAGQLGSL